MDNLLDWDQDRYGLGIDEVDDEHKVIVASMNRLHALHVSGAPLDSVEHALSVLANYTARHFASEEAYMSRIGFDGLDEHRAVHRDLLSRINDVLYALRKTGALDERVFPFLVDWLIDHICGGDAELAAAADDGAAPGTQSG